MVHKSFESIRERYISATERVAQLTMAHVQFLTDVTDPVC